MIRACLFALAAVAVLTAAPRAQQLPSSVELGVIRVPPCPPAPDPEYGLVPGKPIPIGGGPMYMAARQRRYLGALRGPNGQVVRVPNSVSTSSVQFPGEPGRTFIDSYDVSYDGETGPVTKTIYMDAYHYDTPSVPAGFTCAAPLASVASIPPADPFKASPAVLRFAVEQGTAGDVPPIPLDLTVPRGYLFDQFGSVALRARAAALAGTPLDATNPPPDLQANGAMVLALPVLCGDRSVPPVDVALIVGQNTLAREQILTGEELPRAFPGLQTPAGSAGFRFRNAQPTQVRITYAEGCDGAPAAVLLPMRTEPPRLVQFVPGVVPSGVTLQGEPAVYIQVVIDGTGRMVRPEYLGGPRELYPAAVEALAKWTVQPVRINGAGVVMPNVVQVPFKP